MKRFIAMLLCLALILGCNTIYPSAKTKKPTISTTVNIKVGQKKTLKFKKNKCKIRDFKYIYNKKWIKVSGRKKQGIVIKGKKRGIADISLSVKWYDTRNRLKSGTYTIRVFVYPKAKKKAATPKPAAAIKKSAVATKKPIVTQKPVVTQAPVGVGTFAPTATDEEWTYIEPTPTGIINTPIPLITPRPLESYNPDLPIFSYLPGVTKEPAVSESTDKPSVTIEATVTPKTTATVKPTATPKVTATPKPTKTPKPTATPKPVATVKPDGSHECDYAILEVVTEATCTVKGKTKETCSICGKYRTVTSDALGHDLDDDVVLKEATCTASGQSASVCIVCGYQTNKKTINKLDHDYGEGSVTKQATCSATGTMTSTCSMCGRSQTQSIPALGHDYGDIKVLTEPTCTAYGKQGRVCSRCGGTKDATNIKPLGHDYSIDGTMLTLPTCAAGGKKEVLCSRCSQKTTQTISKVGHFTGDTLCDIASSKDSVPYGEVNMLGLLRVEVLDKVEYNEGYLYPVRCTLNGIINDGIGYIFIGDLDNSGKCNMYLLSRNSTTFLGYSTTFGLGVAIEIKGGLLGNSTTNILFSPQLRNNNFNRNYVPWTLVPDSIDVGASINAGGYRCALPVLPIENYSYVDGKMNIENQWIGYNGDCLYGGAIGCVLVYRCKCCWGIFLYELNSSGLFSCKTIQAGNVAEAEAWKEIFKIPISW